MASAATASNVSCTLSSTPTCTGLTIEAPHQADSDFTSGTVGGESADVFSTNTAAPTNPVSYLYFQVSKSFLASNPTTLYLTVDYYGQVSSNPTCSSKTLNCALIANYDSTTSLGAYGQVGPLEVNQGASWQSVTWKLTQSSFHEGENNASDFRLGGSPGVAVHSVTLSLTAPAASSSSTASSTTSASSSSSVPKTGGNPLVPVAGGAALVAGALMLMNRRRPKHAD